MFIAVLLVAFVVFLFVSVSEFKNASIPSSAAEDVTVSAGGSGLHEIAFEMSKAFQGGNETVFYIAIGVIVGIALAIDLLARRFF